jgi:hypothetical protein
MASRGGQVTLRGRFSVGSVVTLTRVAGEGTLRAEGGEDVETKTVVEEDGVPRVGFVRFSKGVEPGARYIIHGINDGVPLQIRARGRESGDPAEVLEQPPVQPDRTRLSDGSWSDEAPTKESAPDVLAAQADLRHVPRGTQLRSDTPRGSAHPVDPGRPEPVRRQEDVKEGTPQMSDTRPREVDGRPVVGAGGGEATELLVGPQRQEDVPEGVPQRSSTPTGTAQVIPAGDAVRQAGVRESSQARESRGDWTRAGAEPLEAKGVKIGAVKGSSQKDSEARDAKVKQAERDAAVAPPIEDVAPSAGPDSGTEDDEAARRSDAAKKAARTRKRNERRRAREESAANEKKVADTPTAASAEAKRADEK